jgi:hypothetical protein
VGGLGLRFWWPREHGDDFGCGLGEDADLLADKGTELAAPVAHQVRCASSRELTSLVSALRMAATSSSFPET